MLVFTSAEAALRFPRSRNGRRDRLDQTLKPSEHAQAWTAGVDHLLHDIANAILVERAVHQTQPEQSPASRCVCFVFIHLSLTRRPGARANSHRLEMAGRLFRLESRHPASALCRPRHWWWSG